MQLGVGDEAAPWPCPRARPRDDWTPACAHWQPGRDRLDAGRLAAYVTRDHTRRDLFGAAAKLVNGSWQAHQRLQTFQGDGVTVFSSRLGLMSVLNDGEVVQLEMPLRYEIQPRALAVLAPRANR